jgi:hypothetical protein
MIGERRMLLVMKSRDNERKRANMLGGNEREKDWMVQ